MNYLQRFHRNRLLFSKSSAELLYLHRTPTRKLTIPHHVARAKRIKETMSVREDVAGLDNIKDGSV